MGHKYRIRVENTVRKGEICLLQGISLFLIMFSTAIYNSSASKCGIVWWWIKLSSANCYGLVGWLVVLGFNATLTAKVISWRSVTPMCFLAFSHQYLHNFSFLSHRLLFSHASAEVRGENTPERKAALTGDRTRNHQVMSPTRSPLSHPGGACYSLKE